MYCLEVRMNNELIYKLLTKELMDIITEVEYWCNDYFFNVAITIYEVPKMNSEVNDE